MKPRRVVLTIELETDVPLEHLRKKRWLRLGYNARSLTIKQVQANVIRPTTKRPKA